MANVMEMHNDPWKRAVTEICFGTFLMRQMDVENAFQKPLTTKRPVRY